jgi:hypothetical protein
MRRRFAKKDSFENHLIMGVKWDRTATPDLERTNQAKGRIAGVGVDDQIVRNDFDNMPIFGEMHDVTDSYGNKFVRIPKFYIKKTKTADERTWKISKTQHEGFYLPKVFWDFENDRELPYFDFGKHKSTKDEMDRMESKSGKYPLVNENIVDMRNYAENNNVNGVSGYQQLDIHGYDVIKTLMYIEFATLDMQSKMRGFLDGEYGTSDTALTAETSINRIVVDNAVANKYRVGQTISIGSSRGSNSVFYGRTITDIQVDTPETGQSAIVFDGDPVDIAIDDVLYNTGWKNGFSADIAASSGSPVSNTNGKFPCMYRGIESPYGDIWQFVDGVNINDWQAWVTSDARDYASNVFSAPYEQLNYVNHNGNGYVEEMGFDEGKPFASFPIATGSSSYYRDYYYQNSGQIIARVGGAWGGGSTGGPSYWLLSTSSAYANLSVGARLLKKAS